MKKKDRLMTEETTRISIGKNTQKIIWGLGSGSANFLGLWTKNPREAARVRVRRLAPMEMAWMVESSPVQRTMCILIRS